MKGEGLWALFKFIAFGLFVLLSILGGLFIYSFFYDDKFWGKINVLQDKLAGFGAWFRLMPVILLLGLFAATFGYRAYRKFKAKAGKRKP